MKNLVFPSLIGLLLLLPSQVNSQEVTLKSVDKFPLNGNYYAAKSNSNRGVLMLHQCNYNQSMYEEIGAKLATNNVHALSIDFRGFGKSVTKEVDLKVLAKLPREKQRQAWVDLVKDWPQDSQIAYDFLKSKLGKEGEISIVGASCGGGQSMILAESNPVKALVFISSSVVQDSPESIENYNQFHAKKPTLFIDSIKDGSFEGLNRGFTLNTNTHSKLITFKGEEHGYPLFDLDPNLTQSISQWLTNQFN